MLPYSSEAILRLVFELGKICMTSKDPLFNHYLFETIATMIRNISTKNISAVTAFEKMFGPFTKILESDIQEFSPYVFQILSLLLEITPGEVSDLYLHILRNLVNPTLWERSANIPAMVRLLQAFLMRGSKQIIAANRLRDILGVFQKLISTKTFDHEGFYLLESIIEYLTLDQINIYLKDILTLILHRVHSQTKTQKFVKCFLIFLSLFIGRHGMTSLLQTIDSIQKDLFYNILLSLWFPNIQEVKGNVERKMELG